MKRRLLTVASVLSLLIIAASVWLWLRSCGYCDRGDWITRSRYYIAMTYPGGIECLTFAHPSDSPQSPMVSTYAYNVPNEHGALIVAKTPSTTFGFAMPPLQFSNSPGPEPRSLDLFTPFPFVLAAGSICPAMAVIGWRLRKSRLDRGACPKCGYDLRASTKCCPECGNPLFHANPV